MRRRGARVMPRASGRGRRTASDTGPLLGGVAGDEARHGPGLAGEGGAPSATWLAVCSSARSTGPADGRGSKWRTLGAMMHRTGSLPWLVLFAVRCSPAPATTDAASTSGPADTGPGTSGAGPTPTTSGTTGLPGTGGASAETSGGAPGTTGGGATDGESMSSTSRTNSSSSTAGSSSGEPVAGCLGGEPLFRATRSARGCATRSTSIFAGASIRV